MENAIYKIRNVITDQFYVGSTVNTRRRFWEHRKELRQGTHPCVHLQRAWAKYGEDCFKFEVVQQVSRREELQPAEQVWLDEFFGSPACYNVAAHADAPMRDASPEMRARLADKTRAWLAREGHPRLGTTHTEETRVKIRENRTPTAGEAHYRFGKTVSEETKAKISAKQKGVPKAPGRKVSAEGLAKIRANIEAGRSHHHWAGRTHTDEAKEKMQRPVLAVLPDGAQKQFPGLSPMRDSFGVSIATLIRACKSGKPVRSGPCAGWVLSYADVAPPTPPAVPEEYTHLPRTRALAKAQGAKKYFTGLPCTYGHIAPRYAKGVCVVCELDAQKQRAVRKKSAGIDKPEMT